MLVNGVGDMQLFAESSTVVIILDPILCDLQPDISVEEVDRLIALELGYAVTVCVKKFDGTNIGGLIFPFFVCFSYIYIFSLMLLLLNI